MAAHLTRRLSGAQEESATLRAALAGVAAELTALQATATAARDADAAKLARAVRQARCHSAGRIRGRSARRVDVAALTAVADSSPCVSC